jgi:hypothetical protein
VEPNLPDLQVERGGSYKQGGAIRVGIADERQSVAVWGIGRLEPGLQRPRHADLAAHFREGRVPASLPTGDLCGRFLRFELGPLSPPAEALARMWMPWRGKRFDASRQAGTNVLTRDSLPVIHLVWPAYRQIEHVSSPTYRAFSFSVETRPSVLAPRQTVLAIDYDRPENPWLGVRWLLDEVVEVQAGVLLGQAIVRLPWVRWRIAYFLLLPNRRARRGY